MSVSSLSPHPHLPNKNYELKIYSWHRPSASWDFKNPLPHLPTSKHPMCWEFLYGSLTVQGSWIKDKPHKIHVNRENSGWDKKTQTTEMKWWISFWFFKGIGVSFLWPGMTVFRACSWTSQFLPWFQNQNGWEPCPDSLPVCQGSVAVYHTHIQLYWACVPSLGALPDMVSDCNLAASDEGLISVWSVFQHQFRGWHYWGLLRKCKV